MKFIASTTGRCVKLFSWDDVRPDHGVNSIILASAISEQFNFQIRPTPPIALDSVIKFADGAVTINRAVIAIKKFEIYSDGFAVDCTNTTDAKSVSDEIFKWAKSDLGFKDFIRAPKVILLSHVTVEFAPEFENMFSGWKKLQTILNRSVHERYGFSQDVNVFRMQWRGDPFTVVNNLIVSDFWIERKTGEPFSSNRWHCSAPLPTEEWIALLEDLEEFALQGE